MATYLVMAETIARRMGAVVTQYSDKRGTYLAVSKPGRRRPKDCLTFPPTPNPAEDEWVPGSHVRWNDTQNVRGHITALRPIFVASGKPGATWADLEAETDFAQLREREKGINEALGIDLLLTTIGGTGGFETPESLFLRPILNVNLRVLLGEPHWKHGYGSWVSPYANSVWVEDGPDLLERLRALLEGFADGTYPKESPYKLLQPDWATQKEAALAVEKFVKEVARLSREPEREYLNYFGFDDTTD
jgi:hypothetical protein